MPFIWPDYDQPSCIGLDELVSTADLPLAILERAGVRPFFGKLTAAPRSGRAARHDATLIEYNDSMPRLRFDYTPRVRALPSKDWRYTVYADEDWAELNNLADDPNETNKLWYDPAHVTTRAAFAE